MKPPRPIRPLLSMLAAAVAVAWHSYVVVVPGPNAPASKRFLGTKREDQYTLAVSTELRDGEGGLLERKDTRRWLCVSCRGHQCCYHCDQNINNHPRSNAAPYHIPSATSIRTPSFHQHKRSPMVSARRHGLPTIPLPPQACGALGRTRVVSRTSACGSVEVVWPAGET